MPKRKFDMIEYNKEYLKENYDNFTLKLRKDLKSSAQEKAKSIGLSLTAYIVSLIQKDLEGNDG